MRFKSVLGAFIFIILASTAAIITFVQTKSFGHLVTRVVTDISEKKFKTQAKVKNFSLSIFPPGLELNQVGLKKDFGESQTLEMEFGKIGFYINIFEFEEKKLTFGELRIADSYINYQAPKSDDEVKEIDQAIINQIFEAPDKAPVRIDTVLIENTRLIVNHEIMDAKRLKLFKSDKSFIARFHLSNLNPIDDPSLTFDEVWGDVEITRKKIKVERLRAQHDVHTLLLKGTINDYPLMKGARAELVGEAQLHLRSLGKLVPLPPELEFRGGLAKAGFQVNYNDKKLKVSSDVFVEKLKSNYVYADELIAGVTIEEEKLYLNKLKLKYKDERAELKETAMLYNLQDNTYLTKPIFINVQNISFPNALRFMGDRLKGLVGSMHGQVRFDYKNRNYYFTPAKDFTVNNLGFVTGSKADPFKIVMIKKAVFNQALFSVVNNEFQMNSHIDLPHSSLDVEGRVSKERVIFKVPLSPFDLEDLGNLANLDIKGVGELGINVTGPLDQTQINLFGKTKGFELLGYRLGETEKNIVVDLGQSEVIVKKMEAQVGKTSLSGNGTVNYKDADIALGINSSETNYNDLSFILHPIFKDLDFLPDDLSFKAKIDVDIFGKYKIDDLKIKSRVNFSELTAYGENFNQGSLVITLFDRILGIKDLVAEKGMGSLRGNFSYALKDKNIKLDYVWNQIELSSLNASKRIGLNLNSVLSGKLTGGGLVSDYNLRLESVARETRTPTYSFGDSHMILNIMPKRIIGKGNILGEIINTDFNLALVQGVASNYKLRFESSDLKPFLSAIFGQHLESENFTGNLSFETEASFEDGFNHLNLKGNLKELSFNHPSFNVNYSSTKPQFVVKDSVIESWNLNIKQPDLYLTTKGEGIFGKNVSIVHESHFNSKIWEVLFSQILSAEGFLQNIVRINGKGSEFDFSVTSRASNLDLSIENVPVQINNLKYGVEYSNNRLEIQNMTTTLDSGSVSLVGDIYFDSKQPDVNLKFNLDKAEIPILGKSSMNLTGEGIILGNNFPYTVGGEIHVNKALVVNELNEFSNKSAAFSQVRFLPKNQESPLGKMFNLNLNVITDSPVRITNSLMDVALTGEVRIVGSPSRLRAEGRLTAPLNSSRIFFKNNEYQILSADINFNPKKDITNPDFDVKALTFISNYRVYPKAFGDLERFSFDLTSDPALPRNSILSLIAFGYTNEVQSSLDPKDQQALNQVGVGSFVFDRFKISDILNKQFGLQINLGTVIEQSSTDSLLGGSTSQNGTLGRTKSATKIELKKRLDEALTLSVSSTMGGSIGQRQSMNLNYGISKNVQIEGVYELRTNEEGEADIIYDSIGGDIKFRRTFK